MNPMQEIYVEKVTLNIGTGGPGEKLEKAMKLMRNLTQMKPVATTTRRRIPGWGLRPGLSIGCKVTLRGRQAQEFLKKLFAGHNDKIKKHYFDNHGGISFGIPEYLDIPGVEYDMQVGIIGLEAAVTLARRGYRIKHRRIKNRSIPKKHRITREEAIGFIREKYSIIVSEDEE